MAFGDRGRYKSLAKAFHLHLPDLYPSIEAFPAAARVPGFPKEAVVIHPMSGVSQLIWIDGVRWNSMIIAQDPDGESLVYDGGDDGPGVRILPARWALSLTVTFYEDWLTVDQKAEDRRAAEYEVSLERLFVQDMFTRVQQLLLT